MTVPDDAPDGEFFDPNDFQSLEIRIRMENTTAGTSILDPRKIRVLQLLEKGLVLEVPERNCASGHNVALDIQCQGVEPLKIDFHVTGKVESSKNFPDDHTDQISIKLLQYPEAPWDAIHKLMRDRQTEIQDFLRAAGGKE